MTKNDQSLCDLHVHSTASDSTATPEELIVIARGAGIGAVALCDHNTVAGLARFEEAARGSGVIAVPGVEVTAGWRGHEVHILGLFIPAEARVPLTDLLAEIDRRKAQSNRELVARLAADGYDIDYASVLEAAGEATPNRVHVARVLRERGYVTTVDEAFQTLLRDGGAYYRSPDKLDAMEVIARMQALSVLPVLAHPLLTLSRAETEACLTEAKKRGLIGVETVYPLYSEDDAIFMAAVATRLALCPSGGSDFHGENKPDIQMGVGKGNLRVPFSFYEQLRELSDRPAP